MKVRKNAKFPYQAKNLVLYLIPRILFEKRRKKKIAHYFQKHPEQQSYIKQRVDYYCKLQETKALPGNALSVGNFKFGKQYHFAYFFDTYEYVKYFSKQLRFCFSFGDITWIPECPTIVKSRPIGDSNENSVLLKLNKFRHFNFIADQTPFSAKQNKLIGRGLLYQQNRIDFYKKWFGTPLCDLGQVNTKPVYNPAWICEKMSREAHLQYKFILCLEGNDVATNLKWVMLTNSLAVMSKPKFETWFMEGTLIPNYHYVAIADDYSDLEERLNYYITHEDEALAIIRHANEYVQQFLDAEREDIVSLLVLQKYFERTSQSKL